MAVGIRGTPTSGSAASTSLAITKPTGVVAGDILLAFLVGPTTTPNTLAGWTVAGSNTSNAKGNCQYLIADGTEGSTFTWTVAAGAVGAIIACTGGKASGNPLSTTPGFISSINTTQGSSMSIICPSITPLAIGDLLVVFCTTTTALAGTWTPPAGMTEQIDTRFTNTGNPAIELSTLSVVAAGASGTKTCVYSTDANNSQWGCTVAVSFPTVTQSKLVIPNRARFRAANW